MKIDRNQLVGGHSVPRVRSGGPGGIRETVHEHIGGLPLRLEIAARLLATNFANISTAECGYDSDNEACWDMVWASADDALASIDKEDNA